MAAKFSAEGGFKEVTPQYEGGGLLGPSAAKASLTPEFRQATLDVFKELNCSRGIPAQADEARMKGSLREVMADMSRQDSSPLYSNAAKLQEAVDGVYKKLLENSSAYIKEVSPTGFFASAQEKKTFETQRATECSPVLDKRERERHGLDR